MPGSLRGRNSQSRSQNLQVIVLPLLSLRGSLRGHWWGNWWSSLSGNLRGGPPKSLHEAIPDAEFWFAQTGFPAEANHVAGAGTHPLDVFGEIKRFGEQGVLRKGTVRL